MKSSLDALTEMANILDLDETIPKRWKKHILGEFKKQANDLEKMEELRDMLQCWKWITRANIWTIRAMESFIVNPATTPYFMMVNYTMDPEFGDAHIPKKESKRIIESFRRAVHHLYSAGLVNCIHLSPEDVGYGRNSVSIWLSPWAKEKDIEKAKSFYLNMGGVKIPVPSPEKKTPKEVAEYNRQVQVHSALNKYKRTPNRYDYYKCPKKHVDGLKRTTTTNNPYKKKNRVLKCSSCNRLLNEIPYDEFMKLMEKKLLNPGKETI